MFKSSSTLKIRNSQLEYFLFLSVCVAIAIHSYSFLGTRHLKQKYPISTALPSHLRAGADLSSFLHDQFWHPPTYHLWKYLWTTFWSVIPIISEQIIRHFLLCDICSMCHPLIWQPASRWYPYVHKLRCCFFIHQLKFSHALSAFISCLYTESASPCGICLHILTYPSSLFLLQMSAFIFILVF